MLKSVVALATVVSLGLAVPAFAEEMTKADGEAAHDGKDAHGGRPSPLSSPLSSHDDPGNEADVMTKGQLRATPSWRASCPSQRVPRPGGSDRAKSWVNDSGKPQNIVLRSPVTP
jgi:hypothetical protein